MTAILIILCVISIMFNVVMGMVTKAQMTRCRTYEEWVREYENRIGEMQEDILNTYVHIKRLDDKQIFEKDDEVGSVFQDLVDTIRRMNERSGGEIEKTLRKESL